MLLSLYWNSIPSTSAAPLFVVDPESEDAQPLASKQESIN